MLFRTPWPVLVTILAQVVPTPEGFVIEAVFKYGILPGILAFLLYHQDKANTKEQARKDAIIAARDLEIKGMYELQSKEYKTSLELMARSTDSNNKLIQFLQEKNADHHS